MTPFSRGRGGVEVAGLAAGSGWGIVGRGEAGVVVGFGAGRFGVAALGLGTRSVAGAES